MRANTQSTTFLLHFGRFPPCSEKSETTPGEHHPHDYCTSIGLNSCHGAFDLERLHESLHLLETVWNEMAFFGLRQGILSWVQKPRLDVLSAAFGSAFGSRLPGVVINWRRYLATCNISSIVRANPPSLFVTAENWLDFHNGCTSVTSQIAFKALAISVISAWSVAGFALWWMDFY